MTECARLLIVDGDLQRTLNSCTSTMELNRPTASSRVIVG